MTPDTQQAAIAALDTSHHNCCRCGGLATLFRYGAFMCGEECAESASDNTLDDGQQLVPAYLTDTNAILPLLAAWHEEDPEYRAVQLDCVLVDGDGPATQWMVELRQTEKPSEINCLKPSLAAAASEALLKARGLWTDSP